MYIYIYTITIIIIIRIGFGVYYTITIIRRSPPKTITLTIGASYITLSAGLRDRVPAAWAPSSFKEARRFRV